MEAIPSCICICSQARLDRLFTQQKESLYITQKSGICICSQARLDILVYFTKRIVIYYPKIRYYIWDIQHRRLINTTTRNRNYLLNYKDYSVDSERPNYANFSSCTFVE
jgi:hypothetical protein